MKNKPERIVYSSLLGWGYNYPNMGSVRKFDDGSQLFCFDTEWDGNSKRIYTCDVESKDCDIVMKYRLTVEVSFKNNVSEKFSTWGRTRREVFTRMREKLDTCRRALQTIPF